MAWPAFAWLEIRADFQGTHTFKKFNNRMSFTQFMFRPPKCGFSHSRQFVGIGTIFNQILNAVMRDNAIKSVLKECVEINRIHTT